MEGLDAPGVQDDPVAPDALPAGGVSGGSSMAEAAVPRAMSMTVKVERV
jgi:hypothetical protein